MKSEVRIDKWLWAMRIFKTRTVATDSCKKGRVALATPGGEVIAKPSRMIHVGDTILVRKPPVTYSFRVLALTENRLGAKLVPEYLENITPKEQYDLLDVIRISGFIDRRKGLDVRPNARAASWPASPTTSTPAHLPSHGRLRMAGTSISTRMISMTDHPTNH